MNDIQLNLEKIIVPNVDKITKYLSDNFNDILKGKDKAGPFKISKELKNIYKKCNEQFEESLSRIYLKVEPFD